MYNTSYCDPTDASVVTGRTCTFPMSLFSDFAFTHIPDHQVLPFTIRAINQFGMSDYSDFNSLDPYGPNPGAVAYSKPAQPIVPKTMS